jgi:hypothetical protein
MIRLVIGVDDTDMPGTPGTNQLARRIADALPPGFSFDVVLRHQLLFDRRVPYTSHNGCASIGLQAEPGHGAAELLEPLRRLVREFAPPGSDPGLCILHRATPFAEILAFANRCQREPVHQADALDLARKHAIHLEPLGGTGDGVIGALAAVGLRASGNDGRVVHRAGWPWPDAFAGEQTVDAILARGVDEIRAAATDQSRATGIDERRADAIDETSTAGSSAGARPGETVTAGLVDVGKHLRPAFRDGRIVLFVEPSATPRTDPPIASTSPARWKALKLP